MPPQIVGHGRVIRELNSDVWAAVVGTQWSEKEHRTLDFSSDIFSLETLGGADGGLWNPLLNLRRLEELNLKKNRLSDIDRVFVFEAPFASSLKILTLSKNLLISTMIDLPQLTVLDISYNALDSFPCLDYLPNLEVLRLSHNTITDIWDTIGKCPKLIELDISYNSISFYPSQLEWGLHYLRSCPKLKILLCKSNPFSNWFPEYLYFLTNGLPNLRQLDDWQIDDTIRNSAAKFNLKPLTEYDLIYTERQTYTKLTDIKQVEDPLDLISVLDDVPPIEYFATQVQRAIETPEQTFQWCSLIVHAADLVHNSSVSEFGKLFGTNELPSVYPVPTTKEAQQTIATFLQTLTLIIERHDNVRSMLLRTLAKLAPVPHENLGLLCLATLSDIMQNNEELQTFASAAIIESLVPCIQGQNYTDVSCRTVLQGIAAMRPSLTLAQGLSPCVTDLASFLEDAPADPILIDVVSMVVNFPPNAVECSGQGVPQIIGEILNQRGLSILEDDLFIKLLHIAGRCAAAVKKAATYFVQEQIHTTFVFQSLKEHFRTPETSTWPLRKACIVAAMIDFLTGTIQTDQQAMIDCVDHFHLTDLLLIPTKEFVANPLVLSAACRGLLVILNDESRRLHLLEYITEQMGRLLPLLQYFGGRVYKELCDIAERHVVKKDTLPFRPSIPDMQFNANPFIHECFCAIARLLQFYLEHTEIPYCVVINEYLGLRKREKILFSGLIVPSNEVKFAAIGCLALVPINNFDSEDVLTILNLLRTFRAFSSGDAAGIIVALLGVLERFVNDVSGEAGLIFRTEHPQETFDSVYELLTRAIKLWAKNVDVERMKIRICVACVEFLRGASRHIELRPFLRTKSISQQFKSIVKAEEDTCLPDSQDITIERCWTGRDIDLILRCFSGLERLNPFKKVAFRLMNQLADVLEGRTATYDLGTHITLQNLTLRELDPFRDDQFRRGLSSMDESEWEDRADQQLEFVNSRGPDKIISYLTRLASKDFDVRLAVERKKKLDSEYWAGRLKGIKERMEEQLYNGEDIDEEYDLPEQIKFYNLPEGYDNESRWIVLQALHRTEQSLDPEISALYLRCEAGFYSGGSLWNNIALGEMKSSFIVAALLRGLYACLVVPSCDRVSSEVVQCCRRPTTLRKLISFLEPVQLFDCHIGSKFLAVARLAVTIEPHQAAESMDLIITYDILCQVVQRILRPFQHILRQGGSQPLGLAEQIFATELCKLIAVIVRQTSYVKFSAQLVVQRWAVKVGLLRFTGKLCIHAFVAMIIYDLQVAAGSSRGTYIEHLLENTAESREEMREASLSILSELIQRCEPLKYSVIEAFNIREVFQKIAVRRSFLFELFESANSGHYRQAVQLYLSITNKRAERVLQLPVVHHWTAAMGPADPIQRIIAVSNYSYYQLQKPAGIRNFQASASQTSALNAAKPLVEIVKDYTRMTRLIRGFPSTQVLIIGWMPENATRDSKEVYEILICDKLSSALPLLQCLYALSGPDIESRVDVYRDYVMRACLKKYVVLTDIRTMAYVIRETATQRYIVLHILTEERFLEFVIDWRYWFSPTPDVVVPSSWLALGEGSSDEDEIDDRRIVRQGLDNFLGYLQGDDESWDTGTVVAARSAAMQVPKKNTDNVLSAIPKFGQPYGAGGRGGLPEDENEASNNIYREKLDIAKAKLLKLTLKYKIRRLHGVIFGKGDEPKITYRFAAKPSTNTGIQRNDSNDEEEDEAYEDLFAEETPEINKKPVVKYTDVNVIYLDDSSRERWRRYVAYALNQLEVSGHWRRTWKTSS